MRLTFTMLSLIIPGVIPRIGAVFLAAAGLALIVAFRCPPSVRPGALV